MLPAREDRFEREHPLLPRVRRSGREIRRRVVLVDRAADVRELVLEEPPELEAELRLVLRKRALLRPPAEEIRQLAPPLPPRVEAGERLERVDVRLVDVERRPIRLDRLVVVAELGLFDEGDRVERRDPLPFGPVVANRATGGKSATRSEGRLDSRRRRSIASNEPSFSSGAKACARR